VEKSSIYLTCPGCAASTLVDREGPRVRCAACGFDYAALRQDTPAYERFLVDRMREGPMGQLAAAALHQWTAPAAGATGGATDSAASFRALAERKGVKLPAPMTTDPVLRTALVAVVVVVVLLVVMVGYFIVRGAS
jgi:hypothetical protein